MPQGIVYYNDIRAGIIEYSNGMYAFTYDDLYLSEESLPPISLTIPKRTEPYTSEILFPFFFGLLAEGITKELQCRTLKIDEDDHFTRLLKTAGSDTIGPVTVREVKNE